MKRLAPFLLSITLSLAASHLVAAPTQITPQATPNGGKRARTVTDAAGTVHLIYNHQGNIFYVKKRVEDATFSSPLQVNSIDRSGAIADIAIGKDGSVHTLFHGNIFYIRNQIKAENRKLKSSDIKYTFYSRLRPNATRFEEQRDLSQDVWGFDGGCTIAADPEGNVYAFFAGTTEAGNETVRHVYLARSTDNGTSFATPKPIDLGKGVCACCHLKADLDAKGALHLVYRVAESSVQRDSFVLTSLDQGRSFTPTPLDNWKLRACPGSAYSFAKTATETFVSWRTENEIYLTGLTTNRPFSPPGKVQKRRAAILGNNLKGEVLVTWSEGENFNKPHDLKWQLYDADGQAIGDVGTLKNAFKRWGNAAVFTDSEGNFTILY